MIYDLLTLLAVLAAYITLTPLIPVAIVAGLMKAGVIDEPRPVCRRG